jgi:hypothetical protein
MKKLLTFLFGSLLSATAMAGAIRTDQIGLSTSPYGSEKVHAYMINGQTLNRLNLDTSDIFWTSPLLDIFTQWDGSGYGRVGTINLAGTANATTRIEVTDADGTVTHAFYFNEGQYAAGRRVSGTVDVQGNALDLNSSFGTSIFTVQGSTVLPTPGGNNRTDFPWMYRIDASTVDATVKLEPNDVAAFINGRIHRVCKVDASTHTVTVGGYTTLALPLNPVVLSYINECVDYQTLGSGGSASGQWNPIGILKSTSTPGGTSWSGDANSDLQMHQYGVFGVSTNSWTCVLLGGVTYYFQGFPAKSDSKTYIWTITGGTVTATEAVTDGVRYGGTAGSTGTFTAWQKMAQMTLQANAAPTMTTAGDIAFDTTDNVGVLHNGTTNYVFSHSTQTYSVTIASNTGAGSGGWDSLAWTFPSPAVQVPISITSVWAEIKGGTSLIYNLDIRAGGASNTETGTDNVFTSSQTISAGTQLKTVVLNKTYVAPGSSLCFKTPTSASSGTVPEVMLWINYIEVKE